MVEAVAIFPTGQRDPILQTALLKTDSEKKSGIRYTSASIIRPLIYEVIIS